MPPFLEELLEREAIACLYRCTGRFVSLHGPSAYTGLASRVETTTTSTRRSRVSRSTSAQRRSLPTLGWCGD